MLIFDVFDDRIPTKYNVRLVPTADEHQRGGDAALRAIIVRGCAYHLSLLTWSPYPGVSTIFNRSRTPFSSMM